MAGSGSSGYGSGSSGKGSYGGGYSGKAGYALATAGGYSGMQKGYGKGLASCVSGYNNKRYSAVLYKPYPDSVLGSYLKTINGNRYTDKRSLAVLRELRKINPNYFDKTHSLEEKLERCPICGGIAGKCSCRN